MNGPDSKSSLCVEFSPWLLPGLGNARPQIHGMLPLQAPVAPWERIKTRVGLHKGACGPHSGPGSHKEKLPWNPEEVLLDTGFRETPGLGGGCS